MTALDSMTLARKRGISPALLHPLLSLLKDSPQGPFELSVNIGCSAANVTGMVRNLQLQGWVTKTRHPHDHRMWEIRPTERAVETFADFV